MTYVLAIYEIDRACGGREEGGWYYDTGELVRVLGTRPTADAAYALARRLNGWMDRLQRGKRSVSSVAYRGGRYQVEVYENVPPAYYPSHRPHYE